jgi:hypothetical protein
MTKWNFYPIHKKEAAFLSGLSFVCTISFPDYD